MPHAYTISEPEPAKAATDDIVHQESSLPSSSQATLAAPGKPIVRTTTPEEMSMSRSSTGTTHSYPPGPTPAQGSRPLEQAASSWSVPGVPAWMKHAPKLLSNVTPGFGRKVNETHSGPARALTAAVDDIGPEANDTAAVEVEPPPDFRTVFNLPASEVIAEGLCPSLILAIFSDGHANRANWLHLPRLATPRQDVYHHELRLLQDVDHAFQHSRQCLAVCAGLILTQCTDDPASARFNSCSKAQIL